MSDYDDDESVLDIYLADIAKPWRILEPILETHFDERPDLLLVWREFKAAVNQAVWGEA